MKFFRFLNRKVIKMQVETVANEKHKAKTLHETLTHTLSNQMHTKYVIGNVIELPNAFKCNLNVGIKSKFTLNPVL